MLHFLKIEVVFILSIQLLVLFGQCRSRNNRVNKFDYRKEYSRKQLSPIYSQYLSDQSLNTNCKQKRKSSDIKNKHLVEAFEKANQQFTKLKQSDQAAFAAAPRAKLFDSSVHKINNQAKYNEYATKSLVNDNCLCEHESVMNLKNMSYSSKLGNCRSEVNVSPTVRCDSKGKYRRIDGKCNHLVNTNWGSNFHCQRRLLPPDYRDGVGQLRLATDGSPLPNPRQLSKQLFSEKVPNSQYTALQTMWGQLIAHDTFNRVAHFGGELNCCPVEGRPTHPECLPIVDIPRDNLSIAYKQNCISFTRAVTCNTCQLGPRTHMNYVTSFLDLSQVYGLTETVSKSLRTFQKGKLKVGKASDGSKIQVKENLPNDLDRIDLSECKPPDGKSQYTCFKNGDGIRGNQNPAATSLVVLLVRRHNQHSSGLAKANPGWNDERLFQEARRLLIAEYTMIIFGEFLPTILGNHLMKKYDLKVRKNGFTKYDPNVDPSGIQGVGGAAFRYGHLTTNGLFRVSRKTNDKSYNYRLKDKFMEMSDIWEGRTNGIIKGMTETVSKQIGPNFDDDLQDHLFFDHAHPRISDLAAFNILRGRDYGLPSYVYYVQYVKGVPIKSWNDLSKLFPEKRLNKLKTLYKDYKDIDLYVGGALEDGVKTFRRLLGIQFFHWKYGDRFYFEHSGQSGSFTSNQLNNIRSRGSLANLLCKTTDFDSIASKPFSVVSKSNPRVFCKNLKEFNYSLFH